GHRSPITDHSIMIPPAGMALAAITVMLWIIWSATMRAKRSTPVLYAWRIALYLIVAGIFLLNVVRYPSQFNSSSRVLAVVAAIVGLVCAGYFTRRLVRRAQRLSSPRRLSGGR